MEESRNQGSVLFILLSSSQEALSAHSTTLSSHTQKREFLRSRRGPRLKHRDAAPVHDDRAAHDRVRAEAGAVVHPRVEVPALARPRHEQADLGARNLPGGKMRSMARIRSLCKQDRGTRGRERVLRRRRARADPALQLAARASAPPSPPPPRTKWTRRVPHPVLIGHAFRGRAFRARNPPKTGWWVGKGGAAALPTMPFEIGTRIPAASSDTASSSSCRGRAAHGPAGVRPARPRTRDGARARRAGGRRRAFRLVQGEGRGVSD